jgi:5-deoxy-glucuronate isomerase
VHFAVHHIAPSKAFASKTGKDECCLVLLAGHCRVTYDGGTATLGPRTNVFAGYPHALYLPPRTAFTITALVATEIADGRAPAHATASLQPRVVTPDDCGFEIRGGGNATRQIVDIIRPQFPAARLLVCEVYTPAGNWSSYPPHKHDVDRPPEEVKLEEIYYYRFQPEAVSRRSSPGSEAEAYGIQRLYDRRSDRAVTVRHGDVMLIRSGYHPFVTAHGYNAYYLNVLAGNHRSMAASDDPQYAALRSWPAPDARVPIVTPPRSVLENHAGR